MHSSGKSKTLTSSSLFHVNNIVDGSLGLELPFPVTNPTENRTLIASRGQEGEPIEENDDDLDSKNMDCY